MGKLTVLALRIVIALALAGSLFVQVCDGAAGLGRPRMRRAPPTARALHLLPSSCWASCSMQVTAVCVWRLLTMVRRGTVFSHGAFRYVDVVIGAIAAASLLMFGLAVILAPGETAPGIVAPDLRGGPDDRRRGPRRPRDAHAAGPGRSPRGRSEAPGAELDEVI